MLVLWIFMILIGLSSGIYLYYRLCTGPIPSNENPQIRKDIFLVFALFLLAIVLLLNGILELCNYFAGPDFLKGFLGPLVALCVILPLLFVAAILQKKFQVKLYQKKRYATNMKRLSANKAIYYSLGVGILLNYVSLFLIVFAQKQSIEGLVLGIYIFQSCFMFAANLILFLHFHLQKQL